MGVCKSSTYETFGCRVRSSNGGTIISCHVSPSLDFLGVHINSMVQDHSTNGMLLNGHKIRKTSVLLMDGDVLELPSSQSAFVYAYIHGPMTDATQSSSVWYYTRNQSRRSTSSIRHHRRNLQSRRRYVFFSAIFDAQYRY